MNLLSKLNFGFNNKKATFKLQWQVLIDIFEQHFESLVLITQNANNGARNQINGVDTSKNEFMEIFRGFHVSEYALWQKTKSQKCRKLTEHLLSKETPIANGYHYKKTTFRLQ